MWYPFCNSNFFLSNICCCTRCWHCSSAYHGRSHALRQRQGKILLSPLSIFKYSFPYLRPDLPASFREWIGLTQNKLFRPTVCSSSSPSLTGRSSAQDNTIDDFYDSIIHVSSFHHSSLFPFVRSSLKHFTRSRFRLCSVHNDRAVHR